jgi:hypothetical protein
VPIDWNREATTFVTASSTPSAYMYRPSAAAEAVAAGVTMRDALAGRGLGHTPRELIEKGVCSAVSGGCSGRGKAACGVQPLAGGAVRRHERRLERADPG